MRFGGQAQQKSGPKAHVLLRTRGLLRDAGIGVGIYAHPGSLVHQYLVRFRDGWASRIAYMIMIDHDSSCRRIVCSDTFYHILLL